MVDQTVVCSGPVPAEVLPRLSLEQLRADVADYLGPRVRRLGYLGEFFRCCGHQPDALLDFMRYTENSKKGLPEKLVELIALTAAMEYGNAYERNQHERLCIRLGFGAEWIKAVEARSPDTETGLSDSERRVQRLVLSALRSQGHDSAASFREVAVDLGAPAAMAAMMVLGRYAVHALVVNTLSLAPPVPSIFEDGFGVGER